MGGRTDITEADEHIPYGAAAEHFVHCCLTSREPITSAREERKPLAVVLAGYQSMRMGQPVRVNL